MIIVDPNVENDLTPNLNIDTLITRRRFTTVIQNDICQSTEQKEIKPERIIKTGLCLEQPTLVILVDVKGNHKYGKVQMINAILQLIEPFSNHRISIHFGGTVIRQADISIQ